MNLAGEIGAIFFIAYWWLLSHLVDAILEAPRLKKAQWLLVGAFNSLLVFYPFAAWSNAFLSYFIMMAVMLVEFTIFYQSSVSSAFLCILACSIHLLSAFLTVIGSMSLVMGYSSYDILTQNSLFLLAASISFGILNLIVLAVIRLVPLQKVKVVNQHKEQQCFMIAWMVINNAFLLFMVHALNHPAYPVYPVENQIAGSLTTIISLYIMLFFSIKMSAILGYKEKSKALEQAIQQEQQYRISMVKDAIASYEVNVTQDLIVKGFESMREELGDAIFCYSKMLVSMSQRLIHPEDAALFMRNYSRENVISLFRSGQNQIVTEYRRHSEHGEYIWVRALINFVEDIESRDVKAFVCIKNIDAEKKDQLELQHMAQRDPLTGLYNKAMTAKLIEEHLCDNHTITASALLMIDVDNFKEINDHLGHVFGDAVLCELADHLVQIFRSNDIVGRIGGDEFVVLLKSCPNASMVEKKAAEILNAFHITYQGPNGEEYAISSSIGISFSPNDGNNFNDLYSHADIALYTAKNSGKNDYKIYDGRSFTGYTSRRTTIQTIGGISQKAFRQNRIEYVFKMLYQSENAVAAIHSALELVASHFSFERGYIFETSKDGKTTSNTFEWCAHGVTPEIGNLQRVPIAAVATANSNFQKNGTFILRSLDDLEPIERAVLEPQGIKSMFQFGIFDKNHLLGFIGFDNCRSETVPSDTDIDEMATICNILATFFVKQHIDEVAVKDLLARQEVMNHLDSFIYVINPETFEVLFMNEKIQKILNESPNKTRCHSFFRGNTDQCKDCPMFRLGDSDSERLVVELYNEKLKIWMEATVSTLRWTDGSLACLISCTDITEQKKAHLRHIRQLENLAYVDALTGGRTYHKFKEDAQNILEKHKDKSHLLVKLDINNFKLVNQIYGYEKGNEILWFVAKALEQTTRNENEIFARVTNDEFIVLFTIQKETDIEELNHRFLDHFFSFVGAELSFKFNFPHGRYVIDANDSQKLNINDLFEKVNFAHKAAKTAKTSDYVFYDERMTEEALYIKEIENRMAYALAHNEFTIYLQPKYYLDNDTIGGAEALTRWKRANGTINFPNTFIPIFEQNGFIIKLDFYIFRQACQIIKTWIEAGVEPVAVSVNFSRLHLGNVDFVKELCKIVDDVGIHRKYLEIEITETVIYDNIATLEILLNEIHSCGFSMSMDDFGSGYSSLGMLKNLPVDVIKIDRSFFANQKDIKRSKTVVGSVIQMAASLGIRTVAEGVEDQEHIDFLRELHCDMVQGYYYAKPMEAETFTSLISDKKRRVKNENRKKEEDCI